jgi:hypothetical protein
MMFPLELGACDNVEEIDFTSTYLSIIVQSNFSPENGWAPRDSGNPFHCAHATAGPVHTDKKF